MPIVSSLARIDRLRHWLARPFAALRRPGRPHMPAVARAPVVAVTRAAELTQHELTRMHAALRQVLDHHPHVRRVLPSLALVERALAAGPRALRRLPALCLRDASARLEALVGDWSSDGLNHLRQHLKGLCAAGGVPARGRARRPALAPQPEVSETSLSRFLEAGRMLDRDALHRERAPAAMRMRAPARP